MKEEMIDGVTYRLPGGLNEFQARMYVHLINWKWKHITREPGYNQYKGRLIPYDAILPDTLRDKLPLVYPSIIEALAEHEKRFAFRRHTLFHHMASSQAANINLFLPILRHSRVNEIFRSLIPRFGRLATDHLDHGYQIEFWDAGHGGKGVLGDKNKTSGTDSDLAIAFYNNDDELCLWLIEHKLTEKEFTPCGGYRSKGRKAIHDCTRSYSEILENKDLCFHHESLQRRYWTITEENPAVYPNHEDFDECPFKGGMNQLWRNQLLGLGGVQDEKQPFQRAHFSVVKHPGNLALDPDIADYRRLTGNNPDFSVLTSNDIVSAAEAIGDSEILVWATWYRDLYCL